MASWPPKGGCQRGRGWRFTKCIPRPAPKAAGGAGRNPSGVASPGIHGPHSPFSLDARRQALTVGRESGGTKGVLALELPHAGQQLGQTSERKAIACEEGEGRGGT